MVENTSSEITIKQKKQKLNLLNCLAQTILCVCVRKCTAHVWENNKDYRLYLYMPSTTMRIFFQGRWVLGCPCTIASLSSFSRLCMSVIQRKDLLSTDRFYSPTVTWEFSLINEWVSIFNDQNALKHWECFLSSQPAWCRSGVSVCIHPEPKKKKSHTHYCVIHFSR